MRRLNFDRLLAVLAILIALGVSPAALVLLLIGYLRGRVDG
jgi:hypothetical protein